MARGRCAALTALLLLALAAPVLAQSASPRAAPSVPDLGAPAEASSVPDADWGPLAIVHDPGLGGLDAGNGPRRLRIGDRCVTFEGTRGGAETLVWRDGETTWDPVARQIVYHDRDLGDVRLSSGDRLVLGGYGIGSVDRPDNPEVPIGPWVSEPDASCPADRWVVHQVAPLELIGCESGLGVSCASSGDGRECDRARLSGLGGRREGTRAGPAPPPRRPGPGRGRSP